MTIPGLMMQQQLLISSLLVHAERHHAEQENVSRRVEGEDRPMCCAGKEYRRRARHSK